MGISREILDLPIFGSQRVKDETIRVIIHFGEKHEKRYC